VETFEIIIAGNGEPALVCTLSARNTYTDKSIAIIKNDKKNSIIEEILSAASGGFNKRLNIFYDDIESKNQNILSLVSGSKLKYEKLVLATGSCAIEPPINGIKKDGVFLLNRDPKYLRKIKQEALDAENIVIFGGGYIGVELSDELLKVGKNVTIIEKSKRLMPSSFDSETSTKAKEIIERLGGKVILDSKIKRILGIDSVTGITLSNDINIDCDFLIICCGSRPNTEVAEKLGLIYDRDRGILVDEYFRTSDKDIFAVGECAAKYDFYASDLANVFLHNTKMEEAKLLGANLYSIIFNRGRMIDYLTEGKSINQRIKNELKDLEVLDDSENHLPLQRL
jgi:NADH oxidase (H2O2-forming)